MKVRFLDTTRPAKASLYILKGKPGIAGLGSSKPIIANNKLNLANLNLAVESGGPEQFRSWRESSEISKAHFRSGDPNDTQHANIIAYVPGESSLSQEQVINR